MSYRTRSFTDLRIAALAILTCGVAACSGGGGVSATQGVTPPTQPGASAGGPTARISEFALSGDTQPIAITVAPDGSAWFLSLNHVNRITQGGVITSFISAFGQDGTAPALATYSPSNDITVGPDKAIWFTADAAEIAVNPLGCRGGFCNALARIPANASAGALAQPIAYVDNGNFDPLPGTPSAGIVSGPNGELWLETCVAHGARTDCPFGQYTSYKTDGTLDVEQPLPNSLSNLTPAPSECGVTRNPACGYAATSITQGPDGAIYIVGVLQNALNGATPHAVFRINAQGQITSKVFVNDATRITNGPDGNLWITQAGTTNAIARMSLSGAITEFALPTPDAGPLGIAAGNDGAIWFAEFKTNKIGRITTSGTFTEYTIPTANSGPSAVASLAGACGPGHGQIWFTETSANNIGRVDF